MTWRVSLYCSARDANRPFVLAYKRSLGAVDVSATGVVRFSDVAQIDVEGLGVMIRDLDAGLNAETLTLRYGRTAKTVARDA